MDQAAYASCHCHWSLISKKCFCHSCVPWSWLTWVLVPTRKTTKCGCPRHGWRYDVDVFSVDLSTVVVRQKKIQEYFVHLARVPRSQHDWQRALAVDPADVRNRWRERGSWSQEPWIWDVDVVDLLGHGYLQIHLTVTWHSYGNHGSCIFRWCTYVKWWFSMAVLVYKRAMDMVIW